VIKAVIFDVDGTLVDSNDLHIQAWQEAFRLYGKEVTYEELHQQMGKGGDQLMPVFCSEEELNRFGEQLEQSRTDLFTKDYLPRVQPFPKVRELFERIKGDGHSISLASSAKEEELERHKETLEIENLVETSNSADDAERSKPHPDIFQAALEDLTNVAPDEAVVVGDTPYDVIAANKAGIRSIGLLSGGFTEDVLREAGAVEIYDNAADLLEHYNESLIKTGAQAAGTGHSKRKRTKSADQSPQSTRDEVIKQLNSARHDLTLLY
jgi:HAD superfamily hydrolase (TIGR01509 family)